MKRLFFLLFIIISSQLFADQTESVLDIKDTAVAVLNAEKLTATQRGLLQVFIEKGAKEHKLEKTIDPKIKQIVLDAIKGFNINVPIILFQHKDVGASIGYKAGHKDYKVAEILCLWIGNLCAHRENTDNTNEPLNVLKYDAYKATVYHELGHYINGHNKSKRMLYATGFLLSGAIASQFLCISLYDKVSLSKAVVLQVLSVAMPLLLYKVYKSVIDPFLQRKQEIEADSFAIKNLLVKNDFNAIIGKLLWYRSLFVWDAANSPKVFSTWRYIEIYSQRSHPTEMERAEFILQELKKAGINLKQIPFNLKESDRAIVQKEVDELIARFFPQYA